MRNTLDNEISTQEDKSVSLEGVAQTVEDAPQDTAMQKTDTMPLKEVQEAVDTLFVYLRNILYNPKDAHLNPQEFPKPFDDLAEGMLYFGTCINESRDLANELAQGNLDIPRSVSPENDIASGLKNLQSTLKHISWQVGQVAKGDYNQHLSFAGEFSKSLNHMIAQLKERNDALLKEIELNKQIATQSRNTVLLFESITQSIAEWIVVIDRTTHKWLYTNQNAANYLPDRKSADELKRVLDNKLDEYDALIAANPDAEDPLRDIIVLRDEDGSLIQHFTVTGYTLTWDGHKAMVVMLIDGTDNHREREKLERVAYYDELTLSHSRHYGMQVLERWVEENQAFVMAFVDLDGLKYVNDTFGHAEGDEYILATAHMLAKFSDDSILTRLGGDEFMLLSQSMQAEEAHQQLETMRRDLSKDFEGAYDRSFSFGVVEVKKDDGRSASLLLSTADECMYQDKRNRKKQRRAKS